MVVGATHASGLPRASPHASHSRAIGARRLKSNDEIIEATKRRVQKSDGRRLLARAGWTSYRLKLN